MLGVEREREGGIGQENLKGALGDFSPIDRSNCQKLPAYFVTL